MACENPVFHSSKPKCSTKHNNLLELLQTKVTENEEIEQETASDTLPEISVKGNDSFLLQKKTIKKVKTVRDVRKEYENYVYNYLRIDLEEQNDKIYSKIQKGSLKSINAIKLANKILESDVPVCKSTWDMITNLNPKKLPNGQQFVLYDGIKIKVRGSLGGKRKMLLNYDLKYNNHLKIRKPTIKKYKKSLLFNSLSVNFKPGPLSKKEKLDISHQKYSIGKTEVIKLPPVGLEVKALYGASIDPFISNYLHNMREENGVITEKWAEFASTALGSVIDNKPVLIPHKPSVFITKYKNNQNRTLMRNNIIPINNINNEKNIYNFENIVNDVKSVVEDILNSVEISCNQEKIPFDNDYIFQENNIRDKSRGNQELRRLDVTVIKLPVNNDELTCCNESYCKLGCVCISLKCRYVIKDHCGRPECMFHCKCNYNVLKLNCKSEEPNLNCVLNLMDLDININAKLSKEEKKFHQTVVVTDDNRSILFKPKFYKERSTYLQNMKIMLLPVKSYGIQSLCMVHGLYRCFCKNIFVDFDDDIELQYSGQENSPTHMEKDITSEMSELNVENVDSNNKETQPDSNVSYYKKKHSIKFSKINKLNSKNNVIFNKKINSSDIENTIIKKSVTDNETEFSARTDVYVRKCYSSRYIAIRNKHLIDLEGKDLKLQTRLTELIGNKDKVNRASNEDSNLKLNLSAHDESSSSESSNSNFDFTLQKSHKDLYNQSNLKALLEVHYKHYKESLMNGTYNDIIKPPVKGKFGLYPWEIILTRYKKKKNYFFVSKQDPFRMFLTVTLDKVFLEKCINVNDIKISEIHKYPSTIRRLLTEELKAKDYFCILYGLKSCWEILGCVLKLNNEKKEDINNIDDNKIKEYKELQCDEQLINDDDKISSYFNTPVIAETVSKQDEIINQKDLNEFECTDNKMLTTLLNSQRKEPASNYEEEFNKFNKMYFKQNMLLYEAKKKEKSDLIKSNKHETTLNNKNELSNNKQDFNDMERCKKKYTSSTDMEIMYNCDKTNTSQGSLNNSDDNSKSNTNTSVIYNLNNTDSKRIYEWFVMELDDDISEIRFLTKGYFVKGNSIRGCIEIARKMSKIVRMSTKTSLSHKLPAFGIYGTPCTKKACILIGPYHKTNDLGIEILKNNNTSTNVLKGIWLLIKKGSDDRIIADPISYLEQHNIKVVTSINTHTKLIVGCKYEDTPEVQTIQQPQNNIKLLKPITICKNDKIYVVNLESKMRSLVQLDKNREPLKSNYSNNKLSELGKNSEVSILKEIIPAKPQEATETDMSLVIISDDDDDDDEDETVKDGEAADEASTIEEDRHCRRVWIECFNIENLGYIFAKRNDNNEISFEFPGLKPSIFYTEDEAIKTLNEVVSRKAFIPKSLKLMWRVVENEIEISNRKPLKVEDFNENCIITRQGLVNKCDVL